MLFKHYTLFTALACFLINNYHGTCYHLSYIKLLPTHSPVSLLQN